MTMKTKPPRPTFESVYDLLEEGDWYLPPESALRLGEYLHALENGYSD